MTTSAAGADRAATSAVIVLNWNGEADTLRCLSSLQDATDPFDVIVVDNGSTDGTVAAVRRRFPEVVIIENGANLGFAAGNNVGLRRALDAGYDCIGVLNNDTTVEPGFLRPITDAVAVDPASMYVSPLIRYLDTPERIWFGGAEVDHGTGTFVHLTMATAQHETRSRTPAVTGCALFAHRSLWSRVGLFDEGYFLLFEDAEWSARANALGGQGIVANDSVVLHAVSSTINAHSSSAAHYYFARNGVSFIRTHVASPWRHSATFVGRLLRESARLVRDEPSSVALGRPVLQVKGVVDALRGRGGPLRPGPVVRRVMERARSSQPA